MLPLQMVQEQVKDDETNLILIFSRKIRIAAHLFCDLFVTRTTDGTGHDVKRVARVLVHADAQRIAMTFRQVIVDFGAFTEKGAVRAMPH